MGVLVAGAPYYVAAATTDTFQLRPSPGAPVMVIASGGAVVDAAESVYDPQGLRQASGGLLYKGRPSTYGTGRFNARWGILHNSSALELSVSGLTVTVHDMNAVIQTSGSFSRGPYLVAIPSAQYTLATADPSLTRVDLLVAEVLDNVADASGDLIPGRTRIIQGTPGSGAPGTPNGSLEIATFSIPAASGTATPTVIAPFTVAAGGILPVRVSGDLPATVTREGMYADQADIDSLMRHSGSAWQAIASKINFDYVQLLTAGVAVTGPTTYTPSIIGGGSATFSTLTGKWQRVAPKVVKFNVTAVVSVTGTGSSVVQFTVPTNIDRTIEQIMVAHIEGAATPSLRNAVAIAFRSGTGTTVDRIRWDNAAGTNSASNMVGSDLLAGAKLQVQGFYFEA